ncbi:NAD-dependent epimerase/dehydratase family protein [Candidatus Woesearchaeota archaeon]|nr:NAD-dependent epimerase/dehydratase family protein [Candidatus Woesearchaeota archaeon]
MKIKNKNIFMTGGRGFIGTNLCKELISDNRITLYDNCRRDALRFFGFENHENLAIVKGDVLDSEALGSAAKGHDLFIHMAAIAGVSSYHEHPLRTMEVNFLGTYNALNAAKKSSSVELFLNMSTSEVFGPDALNVSESDNTSQGPVGEFRWTYSTSKIAAEHLCFAFMKEKNLPVVSLRPFNIYGPGQVGEGAIQTIISSILKGDEVFVTGDGTQTRSWCYVSDMVDAILLAVQKKEAIGNSFNIGNPSTHTSMIGLAKRIMKLMGANSEMKFRKHIGADVLHRNPDISKAEKLLSFKPKVGLDEGILKSVEWYKEADLDDKADDS